MRKNYLVAAALFLGAAVTGYAQNLHTQESQPVDVAVMFNAEHAQYSYGNNFWMYGGSGELAFRLKYNFSLVVNETGMTAQGNSGANSFSRTMTTAGPRYTLPLGHTRSRIFAEGLFGGVHGFNSVFPSTNGALQTANAFGMQLGGGYDLKINNTWSFRVVDVHYVRTDLPNGFSNRQQDLLLGTGIVWRPVDRSAK
jgi:outer membrane immunogenic protein